MQSLISTEQNQEEIKAYALPPVNGNVLISNNEVTSGSIPTAQDLESLIEQSKAEGFSHGHREGINQGQQELAQSVALVDEIYRQCSNPLNALDEEIVNAIAELIAVVAKNVIQKHLMVEPAEIVTIVESAVKQLPIAAREIKVLINPNDLELLERVYAEQADPLSWKLEADSSITQGGCLVHTTVSTVDASVETRISEIIEVMTGDTKVSGIESA